MYKRQPFGSGSRSDLCWNVKIVLFKHGNLDFHVSKGDRIAQLLLERIESPPVVVVTQLPWTNRGSEGFGTTGMTVLEVGGCVFSTPHVSSDRPNRRDQYANGAQLDSLEAHAPEEAELTDQGRRSAAYVGPEKKSWRRKKLSARKDVQDLINEMDPASCGHRCRQRRYHSYRRSSSSKKLMGS